MVIKQNAKRFSKRIIALFIALIMCIPLTVTSFAGYNGGGGGILDLPLSDAPTSASGFAASFQGYRIYMADFNTGKVMKNSNGTYMVKDLTSHTFSLGNVTYMGNMLHTDPTANVGAIKRKQVNFYNPNDGTHPGCMPYPMTSKDDTYTGRGNDFRTWMENKAEHSKPAWDGMTYDPTKINAELLVLNYLGNEARTKMLSGKAKLVIEPTWVVPLWTAYVSPGSKLYEEYSKKYTHKDGSSNVAFFTNQVFYGTEYESTKQLDGDGEIKFVGGQHGFMQYATDAAIKTGFHLTKDDKEFGLRAPNKAQINDNWTYRHFDNITNNHLGFLLHIYEGQRNPVIHTYDIINNPKDPAPAEPPTDLTKGDITIVKLYMNAWKDKSGSYMGLEPAQPNAMFTQSNTTNSIVISDETGDNKPGYNVVSWYVSTEAPKTDLKISDWVQFTKGEKALKDVFAIPGINGKNGTNGIYATQYYPVSGEKNGVTAPSLATGNYDENAKK